MARGRNLQVVAYGLLAAIVWAYGVMAVRFPLADIVATYEDFVGEWPRSISWPPP